MKAAHIHIPKTGGISVRTALEEAYGNLPVLSETHIGEWDGFDAPCCSIGHNSLRELYQNDVIPDERWDESFRFTFVRNPWDRLFTYYRYIQTVSFQHDDIWTANSFEEFCELLKERHETDPPWFQALTTRQRLDPQIFWTAGTADFVGKLETIEKDWKALCKRLHINVKLPHLNSLKEYTISSVDNYQRYYTPKTRKIIEDVYWQDIETFEYKFIDL